MHKTVLSLLIALPFLAHADVLIDVRTASEFEAGHVEHARLLPVQNITEIAHIAPDKDEAIYLYCRSGSRAQAALAQLQSMGYTNVFNLGSRSQAEQYLQDHPDVAQAIRDE